jgi:hypothetical protein
MGREIHSKCLLLQTQAEMWLVLQFNENERQDTKSSPCDDDPTTWYPKTRSSGHSAGCFVFSSAV